MSYVKDNSKNMHYSKLNDDEDDDNDNGSSSSSSSINTGTSYSSLLSQGEGKGYPVKLNVYDLHPYNKFVYWMGLGAFHAGIEVLLREWTFGYGSTSVTGMSINDPRKAPGAVYRETIFLGMCTKSRKEIDAIIGRLAGEFPGNTYHMLIHNCITFCDTMCFELLGTHIPAWLNRLPNFAYHIKCCLPKMYRGPFPGVEEAPANNSRHEESKPILGAPIADVIKCQNNYAAAQLQEQHEKEQLALKEQQVSDDSLYKPPSVVTMDENEDDKGKDIVSSIIDIDEKGISDDDKDGKDVVDDGDKPSAILIV